LEKMGIIMHPFFGDNKGWDAFHPQIRDKIGIGMEKSTRDASLYKPDLKTNSFTLDAKKCIP
jgi:hypothetical protein